MVLSFYFISFHFIITTASQFTTHKSNSSQNYSNVSALHIYTTTRYEKRVLMKYLCLYSSYDMHIIIHQDNIFVHYTPNILASAFFSFSLLIETKSNSFKFSIIYFSVFVIKENVEESEKKNSFTFEFELWIFPLSILQSFPTYITLFTLIPNLVSLVFYFLNLRCGRDNTFCCFIVEGMILDTFRLFNYIMSLIWKYGLKWTNRN